MATGASDGSIIIDTGLDNTGFNKGSQKMEQSIKGVTQAINQTGRAAASSMQPLFSAFEQAGKAMASTAEAAEAFDSKLSGAVSSSDFGKSMTSAERSCASLEKQMQRLSESERMGIKTDSQMTRFQINVEKAQDSVEKLEQQLHKMGGQKVATPEYEQLAASAKRAEQALFKMYDRRDVMSDLGVKETSREWQRLAAQIKNAEYVLESYEQSMESMQTNGTAFTTGASTAEYKELEATLARMQGELARYQQMASQFDTVSDPARQSEAALKSVDKELQQKPKDAGKASGALHSFGNMLRSATSAALKTVSALAKLTFKAIVAGAKAAINVLKSLASTLGRVASSAGKAAGSLAKLPFKALAAGAKKAVSSLGNFFSKTEKGTLTSQGLVKSLTSLKRMLISRVKEKLITTLMQGIGQSMTALAQYSSAFNASMSSMKNAATGLSGNIAVTFSNIVNAVAPAISTIISWISRAISYLNAFFAMLSGRGSVTVAKKQTDGYAQSLGGAAGAAKELKKEVYGFDELNKASSSDSGGGGGGGGGMSDLYEDVPIESLLPADVQGYFESIKAAFAAGDWEGIGLIIGSGLNVAVSAVNDWITGLEPTVVTWSGRIAQVFNGLVTGINWPMIGTTISSGINLVTHAVNTFTTTFDWAALGNSLGAGANSLVSGIDWTALGVFFTTKFRALWGTIYGTVTTFNWSALGSSLATSANAAFKSINWTQVATALGTGVSGIWTAIWTALNGFDWAGATTTLAESANTFFATINWEEAGTLFGTGISSIWTAIWNGLATFDWATAGTNLANGANSVFSSIDWASVGSAFGAGVGSIWTAFWNGLAAFDWATAATNLATGLNSVFSSIDWVAVGSAFGAGVSSIWTAFWNLLTTFDWVSAATNLSTGLNSVFSSVDWVAVSTSFGTGLYSIWTGFWTMLSTFDWTTAGTSLATAINTLFASSGGPIDWSAAGTSVSDALSGILSGVNTFLAEVDWQQIGTDITTFVAGIDWSGLLASIVEGFTIALVGIGELLWGLIKPAWDSVVGWWDTEMEANGGSVIATLLSGITTALANIGQWLMDNVCTPFWNGLDAAFGLEEGQALQIATDAVTKFLSGITTALANIGTWCKENIVDPLLGGIESALGLEDGTIAQVATDLWNGLKNGLASAWNTLKDTITQPFKDFWQAVKDFFGIASPSTEAASVGDFILQGLSSGLSAGVQAVLDVVSDVFGRIWNAIKSIFGFGGESEESKEAKQAGQDIMTGMKDGITGDEESVKTAIKNAAKNVLSALRTELGIPAAGGAASKTKTIGEGMVTGLKDGITAKGVEATFTSAANSTWNAVKGALNSAFGLGGLSSSASKSKYAGEGAVSGIKDGISSKGVKATFTTALNDTFTAVKNAINSAFGLEGGSTKASKTKYAGEGIVSGINDGISSKATSSTFSSVASSVKSAVSSALNTALGISGGTFSAASASKFKDVGKAICQGVADGISANTSTIKNAATQAATAALNAAKNKLGIHSPSKAFAEIGGFMMAGMSNGLNAAKSGVVRTISDIAGSITDGFSGSVAGLTPEIEVSGMAFTSSMDTVANKLSNIALIFQSIADALNAIGGFHLPAVAAGTVIPYKTRVASDSPPTGDSDPITAFTTNFDETMSDQRDLLREIIEVLRKLHLVVDGDSLTRAITSLQRSQERSYGYGGA